MKLTKETLKQIIKEELEAVMNESVDVHRQLKKLGYEEAAGWGNLRQPIPFRGKYDSNNGFIGFVDSDGKLYEYKPLTSVSDPNVNQEYVASKQAKAFEIIKAGGYRKGDVGLPSSMR